MIKIKNLSKTYKSGTTANKNISLKISQGDIIGVVGANGAGKTTLVRQIVGLSRPTTGEITIDNYSHNEGRKHLTSRIAFANQNATLLDAQTVYEVIYYAGVFRGLKATIASKQANELVEYFKLCDYKGCRLMHLSGGQRKLTMLSAAFVGHYPIIVLDEPTNDLDPINRVQLWNLIKLYNSTYGTTFVIVSHNLTELETIVNKVVIMHNGFVKDFDDLQVLKGKYNEGYQISIKCEYEDFEAISNSINVPFKILSQNEIVLESDDDDWLDIANNILPMISAFNIEIRIYRSTLLDIYQKTHEGN